MKAKLNPSRRLDNPPAEKEIRFSSQLSSLCTTFAGSCSKQDGVNEIAREERQCTLMCLQVNFKNPLVILFQDGVLIVGFGWATCLVIKKA